MDGTNDPPVPATGFFRVFHIPNWLADFSGYTFNGPTFIPVDYSAPDAPVDYVDSTTVLINGQPTDYAVFTPYVSGGVTNWGMGFYFDRFPNGTNTIQLLTTVRQAANAAPIAASPLSNWPLANIRGTGIDAIISPTSADFDQSVALLEFLDDERQQRVEPCQ
jgi:hypothetical protein